MPSYVQRVVSGVQETLIDIDSIIEKNSLSTGLVAYLVTNLNLVAGEVIDGVTYYKESVVLSAMSDYTVDLTLTP